MRNINRTEDYRHGLPREHSFNLKLYKTYILIKQLLNAQGGGGHIFIYLSYAQLIFFDIEIRIYDKNI